MTRFSGPLGRRKPGERPAGRPGTSHYPGDRGTLAGNWRGRSQQGGPGCFPVFSQTTWRSV